MGGSCIHSAVGAVVGLCSRWEAGSMLQRACSAMGLGDCTVLMRGFIRTRYHRRRFSTLLQETWRTGDIHWPMKEVALIHHCPYASTDNLDLRCAPRKQLALASKHCQGRSRPTRADRPALCPLSERSICTPKSCRIT